MIQKDPWDDIVAGTPLISYEVVSEGDRELVKRLYTAKEFKGSGINDVEIAAAMLELKKKEE